MSDLTISVINLAAGLLRLRLHDDDPETDEVLRQSAIQLRQQKDRIAELEDKWIKYRDLARCRAEDVAKNAKTIDTLQLSNSLGWETADRIASERNEALETIKRVENVREELATQTLNGHAVTMLDKALEKPE